MPSSVNNTAFCIGLACASATDTLVFAVDDSVELTELYTVILTEAGYTVRAFNHRSTALAALAAEQKKPNLLITDYLGLSMPAEEFVQECRAFNPTIRILIASGFDQASALLSGLQPHRFIQKPFYPEEFIDEVRTALLV